MITDPLALMPALPEVLMALLGMGLLMTGVFRKGDTAPLVCRVALIGLALVAALVISQPGWGHAAPAFGGLFVNDAFARFAKLLTLAGSGLTLALALDWLAREKDLRFEFPILIVFATLGMMMMISANDLMAAYLGVELQSLALYVVAAYQRDNTRSTEAGLKYFVLGALASGLLLYGMSLVYGFAGTTNFDGLRSLADSGEVSTGVLVGVVFIIAGLAFKVSAVPFHMWTPDVYEGAPTPVTAFFSVAPKIAALALLARVMIDPFGPYTDDWRQVVVLISILSMILGAFAAIAQNNIKRLMAYSSIGHVGYALIGIAAGTTEGIRGLLVYLAIYLIMNVGTFALILSMRRRGQRVEAITDLTGLSRTAPLSAAAMGVLMFSMAGIPPLAGFFGKFYVFMAAINHGLYTLAVIGVLSSVVAAFYYLRIVKLMFFDEPVEALDPVSGTAPRLVLYGGALAICLFFLAPGVLVTGAEAAAVALTGQPVAPAPVPSSLLSSTALP
ncbi:NADH-quinone oxidoreductase subunit NuoN [Pararhodospirillum oryzae]|uniref:NADH-quinone oxidoreductase subunit N n=1 Tax=Pararhodospirillum oryzae TaxID=478448 RepID=A0A512H9M2_9PROT|nr:NADH-quinone oxidoreductase subunit NuoN [Pararhodospirillum oryzae]GEO82151.1 NADH-quinone oxidoreductase subunit N [Pararhodospirillum oryzae]